MKKNKYPKLSIIIPVYNEDQTIVIILEKIKNTPFEKEIIIVNDGSNDKTHQILKKYSKNKYIKIINHRKNKGKGAAIRTGLSEVKNEILILQDADLELNPDDYPKLLNPIISKQSEIVYGTRFLNKNFNFFSVPYLANRLLAFLTNLLFKVNLTDIMTGYKIGYSKHFKKLDLESDGFEIETEITAKLLKKRIKIIEVPISYNPRGYTEGKKIRWEYSFRIFFTLLKYFIKGY